MKNELLETLGDSVRGYAREPLPLAGYATLIGGFAGSGILFLLGLRASGRALPERTALDDVLLLGLATHKLSRIISRDKITSVVRAPFTELEKAVGSAELDENPRGRGLRRSLGELLTCPYCLSVWVASGLAAALVTVPRPTRLVCGIFSAVAISDFLQQSYSRNVSE